MKEIENGKLLDELNNLNLGSDNRRELNEALLSSPLRSNDPTSFRKSKCKKSNTLILNNNNEILSPNTNLNPIPLNDFAKNTGNSPLKMGQETMGLPKINRNMFMNYSKNPKSIALKNQNLILLGIIIFFSSFQYGIFLCIYNSFLSKNPNITNSSFIDIAYNFIIVLSWKFQIFIIIYIIYGSLIYYLSEKYGSEYIEKSINDLTVKSDAIKTNSLAFNDEYSPLIPKSNNNPIVEGNPSFKFREFNFKYLQKYGNNYKTYLKIFILTSNIFDRSSLPKEKSSFFEEYFNLNELFQGFLGALFSFIILFSANYYYFGIIYLIQELTSLIPYYIQLNLNNNANKINGMRKELFSDYGVNKVIKYIFPLLILYGFAFFKNTIINKNSLFILPIILAICIYCQINKQKYFVTGSHEDSPFNILFKTYFSYFLLTSIFVIVIECICWRFNFGALFYWLKDFKLFLGCIFGFGICGAICYSFPLILLRICLSNNIIIRLIKYANLCLIDIIGILVFRQYTIVNISDYILGITLCGCVMFMLEFHHKL